jgi:hypothetical protein
VAVGRGGQTTTANLEVSCRRCNVIKSDIGVHDFTAWLSGRTEEELAETYRRTRIALLLGEDAETDQAMHDRVDEALGKVFDILRASLGKSKRLISEWM